MALSGMTKSELAKMKAKMKSKMNQGYFWGFVGSLVMAYVLARFITLLGVTGAADGAIIGLWAWLGFVATVTFGSVLWEGKPRELWYINAAHWAAVLAAMGAILAVMS